MRVLAVPAGDSTRIARAVVGLARRGHGVDWWGEPPRSEPAPPLRGVRGWHALWSRRADVVVGDASRVAAASLLGWQVGARSMVLELEPEALARWNRFDRWAWHSLHAHGLIAPECQATFRDQAPGIDPQRVGLWPDATDAPEDAAHPDIEILERACERSLARQRGAALRPAVFFDRDGTLVREVGYLAEPAEIEILPGVPAALRRLAASGHPIVVISNQSGAAQGLFPLARVYEAMAKLRRALRTHGVELDGIYFCPHAPDAGCPCRKPRTGLLERAAEDLQLSLRHSVMVGDKRIDVAAGHGVSGRGVLVRTGYGRDEEREIATADAAPPDAVVDDLAAAVDWILATELHE